MAGLEDFMLPCPVKSLTGMNCPGCGLQRAIIDLLQGDIALAMKQYPPLFPFILTLFFLILHVFRPFKFSRQIMISMFFLTLAVVMINFIAGEIRHFNSL